MTAFEVDRPSSEMGASHPASAKVRSSGLPFYRRLYVQVLAAVVLGVILGYVVPDFSVHLKPFGDV